MSVSPWVVDADADVFDAIHAATAVHRLATHGRGLHSSPFRLNLSSFLTQITP